jgi:hypothetical protein
MFTYDGATVVPRPIYRELPVANGVTISEGQAVILVNGRFDLCLTTNHAWGICLTFGSTTGNALGDHVIQAVAAHEALFVTDQGALTDAETQPGDTVDINATSDGITTDANHDFTVYEVDRGSHKIRGFFE